ncbi:MAG: ABC transporter substrate-binding protein [Acidimicrobiia bacterium]
MVRSRGRLLAIGLVAAFTLVAASCSNDPETESSEPSDEGSDQFADLEPVAAPDPCENDPGVTDDTIKVGALIPTTGSQAQSFARAEDGIRARLEKASADGELGDREIELVVVDTAADPAQNLTAAQQLVEQEDVFGILEVDSAADGSAEYLFDEGIPVTGWHVGRPSFGTYPNLFSFNSFSPDEGVTSTTQAEFIRENGGTKVAIVAGGNASSVAFAENATNVLESRDDVEVVYRTIDVPYGSTEFTGEVEQIRESGADTVVTGMDFLSNAALNEQLQQAGVDVPLVLFPGGYDPLVLDLPGVENSYFGVEFKPLELDLPVHQDFVEYMGDRPVGQVPLVGWLTADMFVEGLEQAGIECPTREAFITNLRLVDDYEADGLLGPPVDFSEHFGKPGTCIYYVQVKNGEFVPQFDGEPLCGEVFDANSEGA